MGKKSSSQHQGAKAHLLLIVVIEMSTSETKTANGSINNFEKTKTKTISLYCSIGKTSSGFRFASPEVKLLKEKKLYNEFVVLVSSITSCFVKYTEVVQGSFIYWTLSH